MSCRICHGVALQSDPSAIWEGDARPDDLDAPLAERNVAAVLPQELRAMWDKKIAAGWAIGDVFRYLSDDVSRQVGVDPGYKSGGDDPACLHHIRRRDL